MSVIPRIARYFLWAFPVFGILYTGICAAATLLHALGQPHLISAAGEEYCFLGYTMLASVYGVACLALVGIVWVLRRRKRNHL